MVEQTQEFTGKNVEEAIDEALRQTGLLRRDVDIEVISKGSRGIFGLGSEPARVRIRPKVEPTQTREPEPESQLVEAQEPPQEESSTRPAARDVAASTSSLSMGQEEMSHAAVQDTASETEKPEQALREDTGDTEDEDHADLESFATDDDELCDLAVELLDGLLNRMGFAQANIVTSWQEDEEDADRYLLLDVQGDDLGILIGRRGETLASIQYLVRLMINQRLRQWKNVVVDVEQYKQRRVTQLTQLANRMAEQVIDSGRAVSLEPMPPNERRIVHLALRDHPAVYTQSSGEGDRRKVHIVARE